MVGVSRLDGSPLDELADIAQSVDDILGTPIATRVCLREYGSLLPDLIDQPLIATNILRIYAATALALARWEDRIRVRRMALIVGAQPGQAQLVIDADRKGAGPRQSALRLIVPLALSQPF